MKRSLVILFAALYCQFPVIADVIKPSENHPQRHVVVKGDTLWDISSMFLKDPWLWPSVWENNKQIANPHLIYPGDIIYITDGPNGPELHLSRGDATLKPKIRSSDNLNAIPFIPYSAIQQFLENVLVVDSSELDTMPYVLSSANEHVVNGAGDKVYVRGLDKPRLDEHYYLYHRGEAYIDPDSGKELGRELLFLGRAKVVRNGDPATVLITQSKREIMQQDYLVPVSSQAIQANYKTVPAPTDAAAKIIAVVDGVTQIGQYQIVVINRGISNGTASSQIYSVLKKGATIKDPMTRLPVTLPSEQAGYMMIFKAFEKVSYGLVLSATEAINIGDNVVSPLAN